MANICDAEARALDFAQTHREELYVLLLELVGAESENMIFSGNERACAEIAARVYGTLGLETETYMPDDVPGILTHPDYMPGRGTDARPNVSAVWRGAGAGAGVMLAAHTDTMPIGDRAAWTVDPLGERKDGRIYGRGSGDNKFGIASAAFAVRALQACGIRLKKDVVLTAYADEEYGGGNGTLAACLKYRCASYVNLDGGNYEIWISALGGGLYEAEVCSLQATDTAAPTLRALSILEGAVARVGARRKEELSRNTLYAGTDMERSAYRLLEASCGKEGCDLDRGRILFAFYSDKTRAQVEAELTEAFAEIEGRLSALGYVCTGFRPTTRFFHYLQTDTDDPAVQVMHGAAEDACGHPVRMCGSCLTDLSLFLKNGSAASFNFGIMRDFSLYGGAHQPDEFVDCGELLTHAKALILFLIRYCGIESIQQ